jgi:hypothetical protein
METAFLGTHLDMADTADGTFKTLYGMSKAPDMSSNADKIDVTNLLDKNKRSIPGIADLANRNSNFSTTTPQRNRQLARC